MPKSRRVRFGSACLKPFDVSGFFRKKGAGKSEYLRKGGGGSGIQTNDTVSEIHTFQSCAFNNTATPTYTTENTYTKTKPRSQAQIRRPSCIRWTKSHKRKARRPTTGS